MESLLGQLAASLTTRHWQLVTAESCTGGWIAKLITDEAGSSTWFERGIVCYSNAAKTELLGVDPALIEAQGAVSEAVVAAMTQGALARTPAQLAVAVSGVAGPGGGSADKPVGTVWIGWATADWQRQERYQFDGDRQSVRWQAVQAALHGLMIALHSSPR